MKNRAVESKAASLVPKAYVITPGKLTGVQ